MTHTDDKLAEPRREEIEAVAKYLCCGSRGCNASGATGDKCIAGEASIEAKARGALLVALSSHPAPTPYDASLGKISDTDREYAGDILDEIDESHPSERLKELSEWLRKVRYEAVIADRKHRPAPAAEVTGERKEWRLVRFDDLVAIMTLLPPPPLTQDGLTHRFEGPNPHDTIYAIRKAFTDMLAATHSPDAPAAGRVLTEEEIARAICCSGGCCATGREGDKCFIDLSGYQGSKCQSSTRAILALGPAIIEGWK